VEVVPDLLGDRLGVARDCGGQNRGGRFRLRQQEDDLTVK
jgi:hypothetical protein